MEAPYISTSLEYKGRENDFLLSINLFVIYYVTILCIESNQKNSSHMIVIIQFYEDLYIYQIPQSVNFHI